MSNNSTRWSKPTLNILGLLVLGIVGGIVTVFSVIGSILLIVAVFDPQGQGSRTDPMAGLTTFFYIVGGSFTIGAVLSIVAFIFIRRRSR